VATTSEVIDKVRRRVADYNEPRKYGKRYYDDAIAFAIDKLNHDLDTTYSVSSDVPAGRIFLLVKLASIEMCYIRAAEGASGDSTEAEETRITSITVPDLSASDGNTGDSRGPTFWMKLADRLQTEYDDEVGGKADQIPGGIIEVDVFRKISLTNNGFRKRSIDPGLDAVTVDIPLVDGQDVLITWSKLLTEGFLYYEVTRDTSSTFANETIIRREPDNHEIEYTDEGLSPGTYYYRVKTVNPNLIKTNSNSVSATVT
jgi:hypothetical protein